MESVRSIVPTAIIVFVIVRAAAVGAEHVAVLAEPAVGGALEKGSSAIDCRVAPSVYMGPGARPSVTAVDCRGGSQLGDLTVKPVPMLDPDK